jgi:serine/threonine protein kinase
MTKNHTSTIQRGGDVLGSGSYGCVVYPNLPCSKWKSSKEYIGKLVSKQVAKDSPEEQMIEDLGIRKIPDYRDHFAIVEEVCELDLPIEKFTLRQIRDVEGCMQKMGIRNMNDIRQYIQPYGGITFASYRNEHPDEPVSKAIRMYLRMLIHLHYLNSSGVVHMDIKYENIVILNDTLRLIDFGLSIHVDDRLNLNKPALFLRDHQSMITEGYPGWMLEFFVFKYDYPTLSGSKPIRYNTTMNDVAPFVRTQAAYTAKNTFYSKRSKYTTLFYKNYMKDAAEIDSMVKTIRSHKDAYEIITEWKKSMNLTFDTYSAGILMIKDMDYLIHHDKKTKKYSKAEYAFIDDVYMYVLNHMTRVFCKHRKTIIECLTDLNKICNKHDIQLS